MAINQNKLLSVLISLFNAVIIFFLCLRLWAFNRPERLGTPNICVTLLIIAKILFNMIKDKGTLTPSCMRNTCVLSMYAMLIYILENGDNSINNESVSSPFDFFFATTQSKSVLVTVLGRNGLKWLRTIGTSAILMVVIYKPFVTMTKNIEQAYSMYTKETRISSKPSATSTTSTLMSKSSRTSQKRCFYNQRHKTRRHNRIEKHTTCYVCFMKVPTKFDGDVRKCRSGLTDKSTLSTIGTQTRDTSDFSFQSISVQCVYSDSSWCSEKSTNTNSSNIYTNGTGISNNNNKKVLKSITTINSRETEKTIEVYKKIRRVMIRRLVPSAVTRTSTQTKVSSKKISSVRVNLFSSTIFKLDDLISGSSECVKRSSRSKTNVRKSLEHFPDREKVPSVVATALNVIYIKEHVPHLFQLNET